MKLKLFLIAGVASFALMAPLAAAHASSSGTKIEIQGSVGQVVQDFQVYGTVSSGNHRCVAGRKVEILSLTPNGPKLIDRDRASDNGFFFGGGNFGHQVNGARVKALRSVVGAHGHKHVCKADTDTLPIA